jgi:GNAT superfamily N-acetyltransferase
MEIWNKLGKKLFPDYQKKDEKLFKLKEELRQLKIQQELFHERELKRKQALNDVLYAPDVIYYKQLPRRPEIYIVRADRNKGQSKKIVLYQIEEDIIKEVGFLDYNFSNYYGLKIEFLLIRSSRRVGLGSILLKEAEVLFPHSKIYGEAVPQTGENVHLEEVLSFYEKNGYTIDRTANHPLFYKERLPH